MKRFLFLTYSLIFSCLFLFFLSPRIALAKQVDCFVGSTKMGYFYVYSTAGDYKYSHGNFFESGDLGYLLFRDQTNNVMSSEPVLYKVGNSGWQSTNQDPPFFNGNFTVDSSSCGNVWLNARWRSNTDGQLHYCNLLMPKYTRGKTVDPYLNADCIYSNCTAQKAPNENSKGYAHFLQSTIPDLTNCKSYTLQVENMSFSFNLGFNPTTGITKCSLQAIWDGLLPSDGNVNTHITYSGPPPAADPNTITFTNNNRLGFYNFINDNYCGGALTDLTPTPTPIRVSCPLSIQSTSFSGSGTPLMNDYNTTQYKGSPQYTTFTANKNGKVNKAEIYGTLDRDIPKGGKVLQCKITNSTGTTNLGESTTNNGPFTKSVSWMGVSFSTPVNIVNGTSYRLYCKVNNVYGGGALYWLDNCWKRTDKAYRLYMCN